MNISLIITTYNSPQYLLLVLKSLDVQTIFPKEVVIADDGSDSETYEIINTYKKNSTLKVIHSWQKDKGFRAARSRNKAILKTNSEYIVMIDGDTLLHPRFIEDHMNAAELGCFTQGSRVLLSKNKAHKILNNMNEPISFLSIGLKNRKNMIHSNFLSKTLSKQKNTIRGIKTCNMGFYKKDCLKVNGFNNEFEGWGREDSEFVVRLINSGINRKNIKFSAIQFHLWHEASSSLFLEKNNLLLDTAITQKLKKCSFGISQLL
jgi:glycosyltransferase involved in cell wall biosynthesis